MQLQLNQIRTDGGTQPRATIDQFKAEEYAGDMQNGAKFPPVTVFYDGADYWLADGFHRVKAAKLAEKGTIEATVKQGTRRDAVLFSVGANSDHGLQRTNDDKRRAVKTLLGDEEWLKWSDAKIAKQTKTSPPFVAKLRDEINLTINVYSEKHAGKKYTTKHGTTATMKTGNIGRRSAVATMPATVPVAPTAVLDEPEPIYTAPLTDLIPEEEADLPVELPEEEPTVDQRVAAFVTDWQNQELINLTQGQRKSLIDGILQLFDSTY